MKSGNFVILANVLYTAHGAINMAEVLAISDTNVLFRNGSTIYLGSEHSQEVQAYCKAQFTPIIKETAHD